MSTTTQTPVAEEQLRFPSRGLSPHEQSLEHNVERRQLPVASDIIQLSRLGEIGAIQKLFDTGKFDANYKDEDGTTPLHWAAINNHFALCHFLIQSGADINAKGGDLSATPVLWAAKNCNYYIVNLLLQHGADPLRTDDQGFNLLQNATLDGNAYQLLLLLHHDIPVDTPDAGGHTSLMWAAYKGYPVCVEILLQWGASTAAKDENGFAALHWALVKGSYGCVQKLIEYGADKYAETNDGKTPSAVATEMNTKRVWHRALSACGYAPDGTPEQYPFASIVSDKAVFVSRFFFLWPFFIIFCCIYVISGLPIYFGIPLAAVVAFGLQTAAQQAFRWAPPNMKQIHHTPWLAGIFAGTLFWVGVRWIARIAPETFSTSPIINILFAACYCLCAFFYTMTMVEDPGFVPKPSSQSEQKTMMQELVDTEKFDDSSFCIMCMTRKPLRSKHCRRCNRCVAKHDHHCPWVHNCVGNNNHRHFIFYLIALDIGIALFIRLTWIYLSLLPALPSPTECNIISTKLCNSLNKDSFTVVTSIWAALQMIWVSALIFTQLVQVGRAVTTYENMRGRAHMTPAGTMVTSALVAGTTSLEGAELTDRGSGSGRAAAGQHSPNEPSHHKNESCLSRWNKLLGLDIFCALAMYGSRAPEMQARQRRNVFNRGLLTNCQDFICDPAPVFGVRENGAALLAGRRVDYTKLYDAPPRTRTTTSAGGSYEQVSADEIV